MKLTEAVAAYKAGEAIKAEHAETLAAHKRAEEFLKAHFRDAAKKSYRGVVAKVGKQRRFSQAKAKELLGPDRTEECMVDTPTVSLTLL